MKEITIVSGYFDINRAKWSNFKRSNTDYVDYFKKWATISNKIIFFSDSNEICEEVKQYRKSLGLGERTKVVYIEDVSEIDSVLYSSIQKTTENSIQHDFRLHQLNPEVINANYNYIMLIKEWCVFKAVTEGYAKDLVAWVDFGYNHGGETVDSEGFDGFLWEYDFPEKICLFSCQDIDYNRPIFDIVRSMSVYIMGTVIVAPDRLWVKLWDYVREEMMALNHCGLVDDDQTILLMVCQNHKDECEIFKSSWNKIISDYCNNKVFKEVNHNDKVGFVKSLYRKIKFILHKIKYCLTQYKYLNN